MPFTASDAGSMREPWNGCTWKRCVAPGRNSPIGVISMSTAASVTTTAADATDASTERETSRELWSPVRSRERSSEFERSGTPTRSPVSVWNS